MSQGVFYPLSSLRTRGSMMCCTSSVWFVSRFRHPVEGYVTSERIQSSLDDFSILEALANVQ
jgi:hypothetical protein